MQTQGLEQPQHQKHPALSARFACGSTESTGHRRFSNSSWKAFQNSSLSFKHSPKTVIKTRENLVRNYPILSRHNNRRRMFRIQLIIDVLSAGAFLHNSFFFPVFFPSKINTTPACSCHHAISFKQGFKDLFLGKMNHRTPRWPK